MNLPDLVKTALDELRMQMLGAQVLLGFQLNAPFQDAFADASKAARLTAVAALLLIVATLALLIATPCQHRLVERGEDTPRIFRTAQKFAEAALVPFGLAIGCDIFIVSAEFWGVHTAVVIAGLMTALAFTTWYALGCVLRPRSEGHQPMPDKLPTPLHVKIDQMLTEARVILPGAQALLGFQLIATMTRAFNEMPSSLRVLHLASLFAVAGAIILLLAPAAVHRIAFHGRDAARFHRVGSALVTLALMPFALGVTADVYVATEKILENPTLAGVGAAAVAALLFGFWYGLPLMLRAR